MAISRNQPMRPALQQALDALDTLDSVPQDVSSLTRSLSATNQQVLLLTEDMATLETAISPYVRGLSEKITIPANNRITTSIEFPNPFPENAVCGVFPCVITNEISTLLEITIINCTNSGFYFTVSNGDAHAHDVYIGFIAVAFDIPEGE